MQLQNKVLMTLGVFAAMTMPLQAAQPAQPSAATQDASQRTMQQVSPKAAPLAPRPIKAAPRLGDAQRVPGQFERPVITEPVSNTNTCCRSGDHWSGDESKIETEFHVAGTGLPGHRIKVWAHFHNDGSSSLIKSSSATVAADGRWTARFFKVTKLNPAPSPFIEITATQYFAPTQVREPEGEAHALPVILEYRSLRPRSSQGSAASSGG